MLCGHLSTYTEAMPQKATKLSAGVVVVRNTDDGWRYLLLRAYNHWDFPKGMVEAVEVPLAAAVREVHEETRIADLQFVWGEEFVETGPYNGGKVARYYLAETRVHEISLPVVETLGRPEHNEFRWVDFPAAAKLITTRLKPVLNWAQARVTAGPPSKRSRRNLSGQ